MEHSKRDFIRLSAIGLVGSLSGCGTGSSILGGSRDLQMRRRSTTLLERSIIERPSGNNGPAETVLLRNQTDLENKVTVTALPEAHKSDWNHVESAEEFVAVLVSEYPFTEPGVAKGWCPTTEVVDDTFQFTFPVETLPEEPSGEEYFTVLERWRIENGDAPTSSAVQIETTDTGRTCSE